MTDIEQTRFIGNIKKALRRSGSDLHRPKGLIQTDPCDEDTALMENIQRRDRKMRLALLDRITVVAQTINTAVVTAQSEVQIAKAIAGIAADRHAEWSDDTSIVAWDHPLVKRLDLPAALQPLGVPVYFPENDSRRVKAETFRRRSETALMGVTSADFALAETATLTMKTRPGQPLHVSLLPSVHVAVIRLEQIIANLKELYTLLKWDPEHEAEGLTHSMSFITGPSKTADIEATLVHGAHGPRELVIFVLT